MDYLSQVRNMLADGRFDANLIAVYGVVVVTIIGSLILRRLLVQRGLSLSRWPGMAWLAVVEGEASRRARRLLLWLTVAAVVCTSVAGVAYHLTGRDIRVDGKTWYEKFTPEEVFQLGLGTGILLGLFLATAMALRTVRGLLPRLEQAITALIGRMSNQDVLHNFFHLLEWYVLTALRLVGLWAAVMYVGGPGNYPAHFIGFMGYVLTILIASRLLILSCQALARTIPDIGNRHVGNGPLRRYWERVTRLIPFGERCLEAAVYVTAATWCVDAFRFNMVVYSFGPKIVRCIGILFSCRVLIELLQVLLNEAFGLYNEHRSLDQKGRTLVPLLHSGCQYVIYFGSAILMLDVLGQNTTPILAGAGILGLAVGLGAQSLVTDVVSGFFILFEGQYLVGDFVQIGDAIGIVEAVGIRLTQVRDGQGKLYIIPNGQIKSVVNYSKGYVNAVVDLKVPTGTDLENLFRSMTEAGRRLREARAEVLADTEIHGLVELGTSDMTVRAVTKVQPGAHAFMQNEYRRHLKQVFDQSPTDARARAA